VVHPHVCKAKSKSTHPNAKWILTFQLAKLSPHNIGILDMSTKTVEKAAITKKIF
jgi:hypothetical protein